MWQGLSGNVKENEVIDLGMPGVEFVAAVEVLSLGISAEKGCH